MFAVSKGGVPGLRKNIQSYDRTICANRAVFSADLLFMTAGFALFLPLMCADLDALSLSSGGHSILFCVRGISVNQNSYS